MGNVCPQFSSLPLKDDGSDVMTESKERQKPSSNASSSGTPSENEKEVGLTLINPPLPMDYDSNPSTSDDLAREEDVTVPLWRSVRVKQPTPHCHLCDHTIGGSVTDIIVTYWMPNTRTVSHVNLPFAEVPVHILNPPQKNPAVLCNELTCIYGWWIL